MYFLLQNFQGGSSQYQTDTSSTSSPGVPHNTGPTVNATRQWRDVFWLLIFVLHLLVFGSGLGLLGANRFKKADRLNIDRFTNITLSASGLAPPPPPPLVTEDPSRHTETFWPFYGAAAGIGLVVAWSWLALLGMAILYYLLLIFFFLILVLFSAFWVTLNCTAGLP